jgi:hypothetical protein
MIKMTGIILLPNKPIANILAQKAVFKRKILTKISLNDEGGLCVHYFCYHNSFTSLLNEAKLLLVGYH